MVFLCWWNWNLEDIWLERRQPQCFFTDDSSIWRILGTKAASVVLHWHCLCLKGCLSGKCAGIHVSLFLCCLHILTDTHTHVGITSSSSVGLWQINVLAALMFLGTCEWAASKQCYKALQVSVDFSVVSLPCEVGFEQIDVSSWQVLLIGVMASFRTYSWRCNELRCSWENTGERKLS